MDQRKYNIYFHTHTISGIIIAALLYVIFFAGSFAFFKDSISAWQKAETHGENISADYNYLIDSLSKTYNLQGRDFDFYMLNSGQGAYINMSASKDTTISKPVPVEAKRGRRQQSGDSAYFLYYFANKTPTSYAEGYDMGEFLYRLHFLAPLNQIPIRLGTPFGYLLAGIVSFLFLFALITGLLLHWDKIKTNFFLFRPWSKWKTVWTDMHTVLGVIGFPSQLLFAVTGVVLITNFVLTTPFSHFLYEGKQEQLFEDLQYNRTIEVPYAYQALDKEFDMNAYVAEWQQTWEGSRISRIHIRNFQDQNMQVVLEAKPNPARRFAGSGFVKQNIATGEVLESKSPIDDANYVDGVRSLIYHLHFGDFGGTPLRLVFFVLGLMGCAVIISGIMIWLVARNKNNVPLYKRRFNFWASNVFLSACLAMLPVTAFTFIMLKFLPTINQEVVYRVYFYSWLVLSIYLIALRNPSRVNLHTLILSAITCLLVPLANGFTTGLWLWKTKQMGADGIFLIDMLFLLLGIASIIASWKVNKQAKPFQVLLDKEK
ncbi:PepSY-associated TM helix domain-containing protein [Sphingobacterium corticibacter]|uniref:PepSY domain-containing protein n=1 Tax=Sphingobacterium corticibacter TaxID=2171749 RepID=A0A2T8HK51_9SPHI|nr:PepSY-associated TM helix domain-containing protein [Sphingobacterium corticibacter]PVH25760.1 PepSY domain-containing protein [Sphingobacterium corticibacter]